jgi:hypothetical protein
MKAPGRSRGTDPLVLNLDKNESDRSASHPGSDTRQEGCPGGYVSSTAGLNDLGKKISPPVAARNFFFNLSFNQQSEYKVFYKLMCWLAGSLTCRLVLRSPPARRSRKLSHN